VVTLNHGPRAGRSPGAQPDASLKPPTKSFEQATPESESPQKRRLANLRLASRIIRYGCLFETDKSHSIGHSHIN
jgi:hypothetical protein